MHCSLGFPQQTMMINNAGHHDVSVVCQAQAYQMVGQQKSGPLKPVGGLHPPPYQPAIYVVFQPCRFYNVPQVLITDA